MGAQVVEANSADTGKPIVGTKLTVENNTAGAQVAAMTDFSEEVTIYPVLVSNVDFVQTATVGGQSVNVDSFLANNQDQRVAILAVTADRAAGGINKRTNTSNEARLFIETLRFNVQ
ncbi:hypothetical protein GW750_08570 [bacterium]|nr:hypothetical protein [bacterium]